MFKSYPNGFSQLNIAKVQAAQGHYYKKSICRVNDVELEAT